MALLNLKKLSKDCIAKYRMLYATCNKRSKGEQKALGSKKQVGSFASMNFIYCLIAEDVLTRLMFTTNNRDGKSMPFFVIVLFVNVAMHLLSLLSSLTSNLMANNWSYHSPVKIFNKIIKQNNYISPIIELTLTTAFAGGIASLLSAFLLFSLPSLFVTGSATVMSPALVIASLAISLFPANILAVYVKRLCKPAGMDFGVFKLHQDHRKAIKNKLAKISELKLSIDSCTDNDKVCLAQSAAIDTCRMMEKLSRCADPAVIIQPSSLQALTKFNQYLKNNKNYKGVTRDKEIVFDCIDKYEQSFKKASPLRNYFSLAKSSLDLLTVTK